MPRFEGSTLFTTCPSKVISPLVMLSSPAISRNSVDLPHPDGPTKTMNSPLRISRSIPRITSTAPKDLRRLLSLMFAMT